jgi:DNA-binding transcriptional regulator YiaG
MQTDNPILEARLSLNMRQGEFAAALGVTQATVSRWEAAKQPVSQIALKAVEHLVSETKRAGAAA